MKNRLIAALGFSLLVLAPVSRAAVIDECVKMDIQNADSVLQCISRIPEVTAAQGQANAQPNGCQSARAYIAQAQGNRYGTSQSAPPSCQVIGDALIKQNGKPPVWYVCVDYDGSQQKLNKCAPAFFPAQYSYYHNQQREVQCNVLRQSMLQSLPAVTDNLQGAKAPLSCDMINQALIANGWTMASSECLGYVPNDAGHAERCLYRTLTNQKDSGQNKPDCQAARETYRQLLLVANLASPGNYVEPSCAMLEPVIARIYNGSAQAPVAAAPTTQPAQQQYAQPAQAAPQQTQQYAQPAQTAPQQYAPPTQYNTNPNAYAQPGQPKPSNAEKVAEKMQRVNQGMETVNAAKETAKEVMGIFKAFGGGAGSSNNGNNGQ